MGAEQVVSQLTSAAIVVYALQWLKRSTFFSFITADTKTLNRFASGTLALASAFGIHAAYDAHGGVLTVTGLTTAGVLHGIWHWANQFAAQQVIYDSVAQK